MFLKFKNYYVAYVIKISNPRFQIKKNFVSTDFRLKIVICAHEPKISQNDLETRII